MADLEKDPKDIETIVATDCGSTTTKAILIEKHDGEYRLVVRGEAPTTVEAPFEDVTRGVLNAVAEVEDLTGKTYIENDQILHPRKGNKGTDLYISTSSAGGGLQMMVAGVVKEMTAESAQRAALGAGAIVMDVIASNDQRQPHERIQRIRSLRPDMILLSGGIDGGTTTHVAELAELIGAADTKPRLGIAYSLPVIYAGNVDAREIVKERLEDKTSLTITENLRPVLERENLQPARLKIQDLFLEHVMAHAPGYKHLMEWTLVPIMPTPAAVGSIMQLIAREENINVVGVDIGGATTDVFSVFGEVFNRTVSANLGMSYSISNVLAEATVPNILRWVPFDMEEADLRNRVKNKMIRPTTIPQTLKELMIEQAMAREALRLAFVQHKQLAVGLKGVQQERTISDTFEQTESGATLVNMMDLDILVGSGGVLSHAPRRVQAAFMLIDGFLPEGITELAVDSIFMMPQLGVLAEVHPQAAMEVFKKDCLIRLGTCIAPVGEGKEGADCVEVSLEMPGGGTEARSVKFGEMIVIPLEADNKAKAHIKPHRRFDAGAGKGKDFSTDVSGGVVGVVIDARGRPLALPAERGERVRKLTEWNKALGVYPEEQKVTEG